MVSVGRKRAIVGTIVSTACFPEPCLHHLSAPHQLGSSWSAHCSISLCREIDWEEVQGELGQQGNQLGESRSGTGSGQQPQMAPSTSSSSTAAPDRAQPLTCPSSLFPPPQPCRTGKVCTLQLQHHHVKSTDCWEFILTLAPSGHGCGWVHPQASCSSCSLLLLHGNSLCQNVWLVSSLPGVCLRLTPGSKDRWTFKGTKRGEWL